MSEALPDVTPSPPPRPPGRPTLYSEEIADAICDELAERVVSLTAICRRPEMPAYRSVMAWLDRYPEFAQKYARARDLQADIAADETIEIADDASRDTITDADGKTSVDHEHINRSRLRVDTRKWYAGQLKPKKYGNKLLHTGADGEGPIKHALALNYDALDDDELLTLRRLLDKASGVTQAVAPPTIDGEAEEGEGEG